MNSISERLKQARSAKSLSQIELADMLGCGQSTIASIENGRNQSSRFITQIAVALGVDPLWLATGEGGSGIGATRCANEVVWLTQSMLSLSESGQAQWTRLESEQFPFRGDFLDKLDIDSKRCRLFVNEGSSMAPRLLDGDLLLIDTKQAKIKDGEIYLVQIDKDISIKQVFKQLAGALTLQTYNGARADTIHADEMDRLTILGRVAYRAG